MNKLPIEIKEIALQVSDKKQKEVQKVLNDIFNGTSEWLAKVEQIEVKNINDTMSIQLADAARMNVKKARLNAEKIFDAKRDELKIAMSEQKLEDSLWLKSKQIMQLKFKHIEEIAKFKADFVKRYEKEQHDLKITKRLNQILPLNPEIQRFEIETLTDEMFDILLSGLIKEKETKEKIEKEEEEKRLAKIEAEKKRVAKIEAENKRLAKEAKERERLAKIEQEKREKAEKIRLEKEKKEHERLAKIEAEKEKQRQIEAKKQAEIKAKEQAVLNAKIEKERKEKERIKKELQVKKELEAKKKKEQFEKEKNERLAPDKDKLLKLANDLLSYPLPELKSNEAKAVLKDVKVLINKISNHVKDKTKNL